MKDERAHAFIAASTKMKYARTADTAPTAMPLIAANIFSLRFFLFCLNEIYAN